MAVASCFALVAGCSDAKTDVSGGGDRFDASPPQFVAEAGPSSNPNSWTALYTRSLRAWRRRQLCWYGACHGSKDQPGAANGSKFVCADKTGASRR
jgi:hypothetical protein